MSKFRIPPPCKQCSKGEAVFKYEARGESGWIYPESMAISQGLILTKRITAYEFHCFKCGFSRPDPILENDGTTKLWYQSCQKCNERHITPEEGKCVSCDLRLL